MKINASPISKLLRNCGRLPRRLTREIVARVGADAVMVNLALLGAFVLRFLGLVWLRGPSADWASAALVGMLRSSLRLYATSTLALTPLALVIFHVNGFYTHGRAFRSRYKALIIFQAVTLTYLIFGALVYLLFDRYVRFPRSVWVVGWVLTLVLVGMLRLFSAVWRRATWAEARIFGKPDEKAVRNVTVIGGAGYIGSVLSRRLLDEGYDVTVLDALLYGDDGIQDLYDHPKFHFVHGDFRNIDAVVKALQFSDAVVHLGALVGDPACAIDDELTQEINVAATRMIADAARGFGVERFIFASTCSVYGANQELLDERSALNPVSLYARTKIQSERVLRQMEGDEFVPVVLRFATVYGLSPRPRFDLVINLLTALAVEEGGITIFGGDQWRPFVHVDDVARAILCCLEAPIESVRGEAFNVGSDEQNYQIARLGNLIADLVPGVEVTREKGATDERTYKVSFAKIRKRLGFEPKHTVPDGVLQLKAALENGRIDNWRDIHYSNYKTLSEGDNAELIHTTHMTSLYSPVSRSHGTPVVPHPGVSNTT